MVRAWMSIAAGMCLAGCSGILSSAPSTDPCTHGKGAPVAGAAAAHIKTVFVIVMENKDWAVIKGNPSAPYINGTLLPMASHAENYQNVPDLHPSLPNYLWLEGGTNYGVQDDNPPLNHHFPNKDHLVTLLSNAGIDWKSYQEGITGTACPLTDVDKYAPKHNPMIYFDDVSGGVNGQAPVCLAHVRPYSEFAGDLASGKIGRYNFITPNLCDDMHDASGCATGDAVRNGDTWLSQNVPQILNSTAYQQGGALFITWDESSGGNVPIGMIVLSPFAKGHGFSNTVRYDHSSTLRTMQEIFGVGPLLCDANNATDLAELFSVFP